MIILFILVIFLTSISSVSADSFFLSKETSNCNLIGVTGIEYTPNSENNIQYDSSSVVGQATPWIRNTSFTSIADPNYPNARRFGGVGDYVAVPPNTKITFGLWIYNYAGHDVKVNHIDLALARTNPEDGDFTNLGAVGTPLTTSFLLNGVNKSRTSKYVGIDMDKTYGNGVIYLGTNLYSFNTIQPLSVANYEVSPSFEDDSLILRYTYNLINTSNYRLCNVTTSHTVANEEIIERDFCLDPRSDTLVEYSQNISNPEANSYEIGKLIVNDPNAHIETNTIAQISNSDRTPEALPFILYRNDANIMNWFAPQPGWGEVGGSLTVKLLPYILTIPATIVEIPKNIVVSTEIDRTELEFPESAILNVDITNEGGVGEYDLRIEGSDSLRFVNEGSINVDQSGVINHNETISFKYTVQPFKDMGEGEYYPSITIFLDGVEQKMHVIKIRAFANIGITSDISPKIIEAKEGEHISSSIQYSLNISNNGSGVANEVEIFEEVGNLMDYGVIGNISNDGIFIQEKEEIYWHLDDLNPLLVKDFSFTYLFSSILTESISLETQTRVIYQDNIEGVSKSDRLEVIVEKKPVVISQVEIPKVNPKKTPVKQVLSTTTKSTKSDVELHNTPICENKPIIIEKEKPQRINYIWYIILAINIITLIYLAISSRRIYRVSVDE